MVDWWILMTVKKLVVDLYFGRERITTSHMELCLPIEFLVLQGPVDLTIATTASSLGFLSIPTQEGVLGSLVAGDEWRVLLGLCLNYQTLLVDCDDICMCLCITIC
jgi:hypothetical protein